MNLTSLRSLGLCASLALPLSSQTVTTLLNDTFADNDRTSLSLPSSTQWFTSATNDVANIDASSGTLVTKNGLTTLSYFTAAGSPVNLAAGESLKLTFSFSLGSVVDSVGNFRVGLFNSGTRLTADSFGNANAAFTGAYAGYLGVVNTGATANNMFRLYERGTSTSLISGSIGTSNYALTGSGGGAFKTFVANTTYTAELILSRTDATTMSLKQSYTGIFSGDTVNSTATATVVDTSGITTSFDTLALYYNNTSSLTFDNVAIEYSAIPEPATFAALAGAAILGFVVVRRRPRNV